MARTHTHTYTHTRTHTHTHTHTSARPSPRARSSPSDGSQLALSLEQAAPLRAGWLGFSRLRVRAEQPLSLVGALHLHVRARAGSVQGDLPPYEAFPLGGTNSVRGYAEGGVGSGRHFVEGSAELRCAALVAGVVLRRGLAWQQHPGTCCCRGGGAAQARGHGCHTATVPSCPAQVAAVQARVGHAVCRLWQRPGLG
jgi:hypothetical protein